MIPTTIPPTTPTIDLPVTHDDTPLIPTDTPTISPIVPTILLIAPTIQYTSPFICTDASDSNTLINHHPRTRMRKSVGSLPIHRLALRYPSDSSSSDHFTPDDSSRDSLSDSSLETSSNSHLDTSFDSSLRYSPSDYVTPPFLHIAAEANLGYYFKDHMGAKDGCLKVELGYDVYKLEDEVWKVYELALMSLVVVGDLRGESVKKYKAKRRRPCALNFDQGMVDGVISIGGGCANQGGSSSMISLEWEFAREHQHMLVKVTSILETSREVDEYLACIFWVTDANNDINVLDNCPLFEDLLNDIAPIAPFEVNGVGFEKGYYLADKIYAHWATFVKSFTVAQDEKHDVERASGVLQGCWGIIQQPAHQHDTLCVVTNEQKAFRDNLRKSGVGYNGSCVLSQAYDKIPKLYRAYELCDKNEQLHVFDSEETLKDAEKSQLKMNEFQKDEKIQELKIQPIDYEKLNKLYKEFVPQKQLSEPSVKQTCSSPYSIPFVKILETKTMPKRNDFCREKVKPLLNELQVYFDDFQNLFQKDIKEIKMRFKQNDVYLDEIENQNDLLKDQLLEASLTEDIKNLVITSCVEIRNKDLHDEIKRISKESKDVSNESKTVDTACNDAFEVKQELSKRIVELEKDLSKSEAKGIAFEIALQHKSRENNSLKTVQKENENFMASLQLENAHLKQTYKDLFESVQRLKVEIKQMKSKLRTILMRLKRETLSWNIVWRH
ncbi:reverse transcriptase zinc-binding domain-containing protein [Tanacetum coccineum]